MKCVIKIEGCARVLAASAVYYDRARVCVFDAPHTRWCQRRGAQLSQRDTPDTSPFGASNDKHVCVVFFCLRNDFCESSRVCAKRRRGRQNRSAYVNNTWLLNAFACLSVFVCVCVFVNQLCSNSHYGNNDRDVRARNGILANRVERDAGVPAVCECICLWSYNTFKKDEPHVRANWTCPMWTSALMWHIRLYECRVYSKPIRMRFHSEDF